MGALRLRGCTVSREARTPAQVVTFLTQAFSLCIISFPVEFSYCISVMAFPLPSVNDICEVAFYLLVLKYWCAFSFPTPRCGMWVCSGWFDKHSQSTHHMPCSMLAPVIHNHETIFILFIFYFTYFISKLYIPLWAWNSGPTLRSRVMCSTS